MNDLSPLDALAAELGSISGRVERELRLQVSLMIAELRESIATARAERLQWRAELDDVLAAWEMRLAQRMESVRDGEPGEKGDTGESIEGPPGRDGQDGRSFSVRGTYADGERYDALSVVALGGSSFVALHDDPGRCPGDGWQLLSPRGKAGPPGPKGDRGEAIAGPPGPPGRSPTAMSVTQEGLLTLSLDDGSSVVCDLYPVLAQLR
ncbi:MAG TPA: hypothetical protein VHM22_18515 [Bradyrhizobium sp.]|jgi:hypothetical protein|nr:hypothetical protein [Bradyrhizobium sp.]